MATKNIGSVAVATESVYGSVGADGLPDATGLTYRVMEIADRAQITQPGEPVITQVNRSRAGAYAHVPDPSLWTDGTLRRNGSITLSTPVRGIGDFTQYTSFDEMPMHKLLRTCLNSLSEAPGLISAVGAGGTVRSFTPSEYPAGPLVQDGRIAARGINGRWEYSCLYDAAATPAVWLNTPDFSTAPADAEAVRLMRTYYAPSLGLPGSGSVSLDIRGDGWRAQCFGCNVTKLTLAMEEGSRRLTLSVDIDCAYIAYDGVAAIEAEEVADGAVAHQLGAYAILGTDGYQQYSPTGEGPQARESFCLDAFSLEITFTRAKAGCGETILGHNRSEMTDFDATMTLMVSGVYGTTAQDLFTSTMRPVLVGFGGGGLMEEGEGFCVYMPAAVLQNDAGKRDFGADYLRTQLVYKAGHVGPAAGGPGNAILRIGCW